MTKYERRLFNNNYKHRCKVSASLLKYNDHINIDYSLDFYSFEYENKPLVIVRLHYKRRSNCYFLFKHKLTKEVYPYVYFMIKQNEWYI